MADVELHLDVDGLDELEATTEAIAEVEHDLPDDLVGAIRDKAQELAERARDRVVSEPAYGIKHTGLRDKMAAGTDVDETLTGADIVVDPEGEDERLPADMDEGGWRHPVYGNRSNWVSQGGYFSWFTDTMDEGEDEFEDALGRVIDGAIDKIASA